MLVFDGFLSPCVTVAAKKKEKERERARERKAGRVWLRLFDAAAPTLAADVYRVGF